MAAIKPSTDQARVMKAIRRAHEKGRTEVTLGGLAGTGKTFVASRLREYLNMKRVIYLAPTGKAARNLARRLPEGSLVSTIHSHLYNQPLQLHCTKCPAARDLEADCHGEGSCGCQLSWSLKRVDGDGDMVVIDESSMVDRAQYDDLREAMPDVFKVFIGDHGQLPPVRSTFNLMGHPDLKLEQIHRQAKGSPIIRLAMLARAEARLPRGIIGDGVTRDYPSGLRIGWDADDNDAMILTYTKAERLSRNRQIRQSLGFKASHPVPGDLVICRDNNKKKGVVNGTRGRVVSIDESVHYRDAYMVEVDLFEDGDTFEGYVPRDQFNNANQVRWQWGRTRWEYAYALTVHLAQGSEAKRVVLIEQQPAWKDPDWSRWLYTGITRASEQLTILVYPRGYSR